MLFNTLHNFSYACEPAFQIKNTYKNVKALGINQANSHITLQHKMFTLIKDFSGDKWPRASFILINGLHLQKLSQS